MFRRVLRRSGRDVSVEAARGDGRGGARGGGEKQRCCSPPVPTTRPTSAQLPGAAHRCELVQGATSSSTETMSMRRRRTLASGRGGLPPVRHDAFLTRKSSATTAVGVPGLVRAYAKGNVALVNAIATVRGRQGHLSVRARDDPLALSEERSASKCPPMYAPASRTPYVLEHLDELVVKAVTRPAATAC